MNKKNDCHGFTYLQSIIINLFQRQPKGIMRNYRSTLFKPFFSHFFHLSHFVLLLPVSLSRLIVDRLQDLSIFSIASYFRCEWFCDSHWGKHLLEFSFKRSNNNERIGRAEKRKKKKQKISAVLDKMKNDSKNVKSYNKNMLWYVGSRMLRGIEFKSDDMILHSYMV